MPEIPRLQLRVTSRSHVLDNLTMYTVGRLIHQLNSYDKALPVEALLDREEVNSFLLFDNENKT